MEDLSKADFSGWATVAGVKCTDGRTIMPGAFKHQDQTVVPLVWAHQSGDPMHILGHVVLEHKDKGVRAYAFFNDTENGQQAKTLVHSKDIRNLSIYANKLVEQGKNVIHGMIREVSLVLAGANPGAWIDNIGLAHGDEDILEEALIYTDEDIIEGSEMVHSDEPITKEIDPMPPVIDKPVEDETVIEHADAEQSVQDILDTYNPAQLEVLHLLLGEAVSADSTATHSDIDTEALTTLQHELTEGLTDMRNLFQSNNNGGTATIERKSLSHDDMGTLIKDMKALGSLKDSYLQHEGDYGIDDIDFLFPDARTLTNSPDYLSRRMDWVANVLDSTNHSPISRIKSIVADITADEARAKGYVKGELKKDEIIKLLRRTTTPKTIYKKQKLDRDDIIDITDIDVVVWLKAEMRLMLDEEVAISILIGDGRASDDEDKIDEDHLRPIAYDVDMYNTTIALDGTPTPAETVDAVVRARSQYKGTGTPTLYTTDSRLTDLILDKDTLGRRIYTTEADLAAALRVKEIVVVEAMERDTFIWGVIVNLADYTVGADKGGEISFFDDFDIDYNQEKYLIETRISGALTKPKSAITITVNPGTVVTPAAPTFVQSTGVVTIVATTGVIYKNRQTGTVLSSGAQTALASGATLEVGAYPSSSSYTFAHGADTEWDFTR